MKVISVKKKRRDAIRVILSDGTGASHEDIVSSLKSRGITASQATVSRDLREMGVVKIPVNGGKAAYRLGASIDLLDRRFLSFEISYEAIGNIVVIKTASGRAPGLCVQIDRQAWPEVAGTVAGDDTILVIARSPEGAVTVLRMLDEMHGKGISDGIV